MNENWVIALVIFGLGQAVVLISAGVLGYIILHGKISDDRIQSEHRFTKLEGQIERWAIVTGTNALHSPEDHLGTDSALEEFVVTYRDHNHDMPDDKWEYYRSVFRNIMDNEKATANEHALAEALWELCDHKLQRSGFHAKELQT